MKSQLILALLLSTLSAQAEISKAEKFYLDLEFFINAEKVEAGRFLTDHKVVSKEFEEGDFKVKLQKILGFKELEDGSLSITPQLDLHQSVRINFKHFTGKHTVEYCIWDANRKFLVSSTRKKIVESGSVVIQKDQMLGFSVSGNSAFDGSKYIIKYSKGDQKWTATGYQYIMNSEGAEHTAKLKVFNGAAYLRSPLQKEG